MPQENVEIVRQLVEAVNNRRVPEELLARAVSHSGGPTQDERGPVPPQIASPPGLGPGGVGFLTAAEGALPFLSSPSGAASIREE